MRLVDLNPAFVNLGDRPGHRGYGVELDCPCGKCGYRLNVPFQVALDGHPTPYGKNGWEREGDTFDALTLKPSIQRRPIPDALDNDYPGACGWHGFITKGEVTPC